MTRNDQRSPETTASPNAAQASRRVELIAIPGLPDFSPGDDLAARIVSCGEQANVKLETGDVVVVAQKVVSKCEGAYVDLATIVPSPQALEIARTTGKDARLIALILSESSEVLRAREGVMIVAHRSGHVMANAGIDASNLPAGVSERVLKLPVDADAAALQLKTDLQRLSGADVGVIINDSWGRAWRNGTIGHAVGAAGFPALWDRRGERDMYGRVLQATQIGLADEIAAAASLVMGGGAERQPVVIVRGLALPSGDGAARDLVREKALDLFR